MVLVGGNAQFKLLCTAVRAVGEVARFSLASVRLEHSTGFTHDSVEEARPLSTLSKDRWWKPPLCQRIIKQRPKRNRRDSGSFA